MKLRTLCIPALLLASAACDNIPPETYFDRGSPESLLDASSEVVTVRLDSEQSIDEIIEWIENDQPTRAELYCYNGDPFCDTAEEIFALYGIDYEYIQSDVNETYLVYERVVARDCENRYIDNSINPYRLNHPTFGCSMAANMVQMVSDKRQFISPPLLGYADAANLIKSYNDFVSSSEVEAPTSSTIENISLD
jgi:hypothetical protein